MIITWAVQSSENKKRKAAFETAPTLPKEAVRQLRDLGDDVRSVKESLAQLRELQDNVKAMKKAVKEKALKEQALLKGYGRDSGWRGGGRGCPCRRLG